MLLLLFNICVICISLNMQLNDDQIDPWSNNAHVDFICCHKVLSSAVQFTCGYSTSRKCVSLTAPYTTLIFHSAPDEWIIGKIWYFPLSCDEGNPGKESNHAQSQCAQQRANLFWSLSIYHLSYNCYVWFLEKCTKKKGYDMKMKNIL